MMSGVKEMVSFRIRLSAYWIMNESCRCFLTYRKLSRERFLRGSKEPPDPDPDAEQIQNFVHNFRQTQLVLAI